MYLSCNALLQSFREEVIGIIMHFQHIQILVKSQMYVGNSVIQGVPFFLSPTAVAYLGGGGGGGLRGLAGTPHRLKNEYN